MGKDLAEKFPSAKAWFDRANAALGYDLAAICFNGPEAELTKTENAQPGIFLASWVCFELLKEHMPKLKFDATAGLSLGEFTALTAAGAMSFEDGLRVVRQRGKFMQEACDATRGGMAAIIGQSRRTRQSQRREARDSAAGRRRVSFAADGGRAAEAAKRTGKNQNFLPGGVGDFKCHGASACRRNGNFRAAGRAGHIVGAVGKIHARSAGAGIYAIH